MSNTATLISQTFSNAPTSDIGVVLDKRQYIRRPAFGSNWTDIQIGVMASINPNGTSSINFPNFVIGMCSGTAAAYGSSSTTNFVGANFSGLNSSDPGLYSSNSGNPIYTIGSTNKSRAIKRVGSTVTNSASALHATFPIISTNNGSIQRRTPFIIRITKGSPNYTIAVYFLGNITTDISLSSFQTAMTTLAPGSVGGFTLLTGSSTLAVDESAGAFDNVNVYWELIPYYLELYCVYIVKFA